MTGRSDVRTLTDTMYALQQAQIERERMTKGYEKQRAAKVVTDHARAHDWPQEDQDEVLGALGLVQTPATGTTV